MASSASITRPSSDLVTAEPQPDSTDLSASAGHAVRPLDLDLDGPDQVLVVVDRVVPVRRGELPRAEVWAIDPRSPCCASGISHHDGSSR